jgi:hypothetical protein
MAENVPGVAPITRFLLDGVKRQVQDYSPEFWLYEARHNRP